MSSQFEINTTATLATLQSESRSHNALLTEALTVIKDYGNRLTAVEIEQARERTTDESLDRRISVMESLLSNRSLSWPKLLAGTAAVVATLVGLGLWDRVT